MLSSSQLFFKRYFHIASRALTRAWFIFSYWKAVDPPTLAVVSLDSTKTMRFTGGPIRWPLWHAGYQRDVENSDKDVIVICESLFSFSSYARK